MQEPRSGIIAVGYLVSVGIGDLRGLSCQVVGILGIVVGGIAGDGLIPLCQRTKEERFQYHEHESRADLTPWVLSTSIIFVFTGKLGCSVKLKGNFGNQ